MNAMDGSQLREKLRHEFFAGFFFFGTIVVFVLYIIRNLNPFWPVFALVYGCYCGMSELKKLNGVAKQLQLDESFYLRRVRPGIDDSCLALVGAANIRRELGYNYPEIIFRVIFTGYYKDEEIEVFWTGGPTESELRDRFAKYQTVRFNKVTNTFDRCKTPFNRLFGGAEILTFRRGK